MNHAAANVATNKTRPTPGTKGIKAMPWIMRTADGVMMWFLQ